MRLCKTNVKVPGYGEGLVPLSTLELREPCFPMESLSVPRNIHVSPRQLSCLCWSYVLPNILIPPPQVLDAGLGFLKQDKIQHWNLLPLKNQIG